MDVLPLAQGGFSLDTLVFPSPLKPYIPNFNLTRIDVEPVTVDVLPLAQGGFSLDTQVFPSPLKPYIPNFNLTRIDVEPVPVDVLPHNLYILFISSV